ncbi:MAG: SPFH domain-containing protein [Gemmataceae bacterium]
MTRFRRWLWLVLIGAGLLARSALFTLDSGEFAQVTRFGEQVALYDGALHSGLHVKAPWPIDRVQRLDRRVQVIDLPAVETLTQDAGGPTIDKTLSVDVTIVWRVPEANAAEQFLRTLGTAEQARRVIAPRINSRLASILSTMPMDALISVAKDDAIAARSATLHARLLGTGAEALPTQFLQEYGIELQELRLRRFGYPEAVRQSITDRIRSERLRKVADYESEGRKLATDITSAAEKEARTVESNARAQKILIEGQADVEADQIRNQAHAKDPAFYAFLQKLRTYQALLADTRDVILLSTKHPLFEWLLNPPVAPMAPVPVPRGGTP